MDTTEFIKRQQELYLERADDWQNHYDWLNEAQRKFRVAQIVESRKPRLFMRRDDPPDVRRAILKAQSIAKANEDEEITEIKISARRSMFVQKREPIKPPQFEDKIVYSESEAKQMDLWLKSSFSSFDEMGKEYYCMGFSSKPPTIEDSGVLQFHTHDDIADAITEKPVAEEHGTFSHRAYYQQGLLQIAMQSTVKFGLIAIKLFWRFYIGFLILLMILKR